MWANTAFTFSVQEKEIYEIVVGNDRKDSELSPGVYRVDGRSGRSVLVLPGETLEANRSNKGILGYVGHVGGREPYEILSIINGRVTLLNHTTTPSAPSSYLTLGGTGRSGLPVVDAVHGSPVSIPEIRSLEDVSIFLGPMIGGCGLFPRGGRMVLLSIRSRSPLGDGVTIGMVVEWGAKDSKVAVHGQRAWVLGHKFLDVGALERIVPRSAMTTGAPLENGVPSLPVYAPSSISRFRAQLERTQGSPMARAWIEQINRFQNVQVDGPQKSEGNFSIQDITAGVPIFDLIGRSETLDSTPIEMVYRNGSLEIGLTFDPNASSFHILKLFGTSLRKIKIGRRELYFIGAEDMKSATIGRMPIDRSKNGKFLIQSEFVPEEMNKRPEEADSFLFFSNGAPTILTRNLSKGDGPYQTLKVNMPNLSSTDQIHFVRRRGTYEGRIFQTFLISRKSERAERAEIYAFVVSESESLTPVSLQKIYEGPAISAKEMSFRVLDHEGDILFDTVSPVKGPVAYLKSEEGTENESANLIIPRKTIPYKRVMSSVSGSEQVYLRALKEEVLVDGFLNHRVYDPTGARTNHTGFYLTSRTESSGTHQFIAGFPLLSRADKSQRYRQQHIMQTKVLQPDLNSGTRFPPIQVSLVPYSEREPTKGRSKSEVKSGNVTEVSGAPVDVSKFRLAISLTPAVEVGSGSRMNGVIKDMEMPFPYRSLVYTQVLQGYKGSSNEFDVLVFTRHDERVNGSTDAVYVAHGEIRWDTSGSEQFKVEMGPFNKIHRGPVPPGSVRSHLLMDAEGKFYWVEDPTADRDSSKYRVRRLSRPLDLVDPRVGHVLQFREPDHLKETEVGFVADRHRYGGRWEIFTSFGLMDSVSGLREYLDRRKGKTARRDRRPKGKEDRAEDQADMKTDDDESAAKRSEFKPDDRAENIVLEAFDKYLDSLATPNSSDRLDSPKVIVVEPSLKERFKLKFFSKLVEGPGPMNLSSNNINYFHANGSLDDVEVAEELQHISGLRKDRTRMLYVDSELLKVKEMQTRDKSEYTAKDLEELSTLKYGWGDGQEQEHPYPFSAIEQSAKADLLVLLASEGRAKSIKGWKKLKNSINHLPMVTIVTPQEWRDVQTIHAKEVASGVLDSFETNFDFLTSSWTVWPPRTEKAPDDIKALAKTLYKPEEMRVFPTLERILTEAASGKSVGKQKIIIVPEEIKSLVQKLIMLRWASGDAASGAWNYTNRKLALHKILGGNNFQSVVQDNFRAMRGAAHSRNSVFYTDLEAVIRAGRPVMSGNGGHEASGFRIRDPIRASKGYLMEMEAQRGSAQGEILQAGSDDEEDELVTVEAIREEIESVNTQLADLRTELDNLERRRRVVSGDVTSVRTIDGQIQAMQSEVNTLKPLRASLEKRLESLEEESGDDDNAEQKDAKAVRRVTDRSAYPHMLWWIASEGQAVQPKKRSGWSLKQAVDRRVSTILVGSEEELQRLVADTAFESKFFNISEHFEITRLEAPDDDTKFQLVQQLFERPEVSSMGIRFELDKNNEREPRSQLIHHFINRIDQLAYDEKIERTSAFIRAFIALKNSLSEDLDLRRNRFINDKFIERLFTRVFPMPLKADILEENDPLIRLRDRDQAVRDLQMVGYEGSPDLKRRVFDTFLSQTRPTDTSRPIPNSQIFFGGTSTGKTFLLESLFKMLGLVEYNAGKATNEEADYIIVKVQKLTDEDTTDPDKMNVKEAIAQILDLMAQPKGARAHVVFDDFHKAASKGVREQLSQFIAALFEAKQGMHLVRSKDGKRQFEIPVQNLNIYMTINPASNERIRKEWVKESLSGNERLKREVLAALSGDGFTPEESFLARWGDIINLDNFPRSAKVPELVKRVRSHAGKSGQMVLVDPLVVDTLIDRFPSAHARELLSPATAALTSVPPNAVLAPIYLVSVREKAMHSSVNGTGSRQDGFSQHDLQHEVRRFTQVDAVIPGDVHSLARFMGFAMRNFRLHVLNNVALEAHMTDILRLDVPGQTNILKNNFLLGLSTHVLDNPRIPTGAIEIRPEQYGFLGRSQLEDLVRFQNARKGEGTYFPVNLELQDRRDEMDLDRFRLGFDGIRSQPKTRRDVLSETLARTEQILRKAMAIYMRLDSEDQLRDIGQWSETQIKDWFYKLTEREPEAEFRKTSRELIELFFDFMDKIHSPDLADDGKGHVRMHFYDQVRLFSYIIDKAVVRMPWGQIGNFTINASTLSSDMSLGTRTGFREYVGTQQLSLFSMATPEFMNDIFLQMASASDGSMPETLTELKDHFATVCESLMSGNGTEVEK